MKATRVLFHATLMAGVLALSGCAAPYEPIPAGYAGPMANIADSIQTRSTSVANVFAVTEIDGNRVDNTFTASASASRNQGFRLNSQGVERNVRAAPLKLKLSAHPQTGAPIQAMAMQLAGTYYTAEGTIDFTPQAGARYVVRGELKKGGSAVWLEDLATGQAVSAKVAGQP